MSYGEKGYVGVRITGLTDDMEPVIFAPCPKCRIDTITVIYMQDGGGISRGGWPRSCKQKDEHFDAICDRCQHRWEADMEGRPM